MANMNPIGAASQEENPTRATAIFKLHKPHVLYH
jgi:hypothetical protein